MNINLMGQVRLSIAIFAILCSTGCGGGGTEAAPTVDEDAETDEVIAIVEELGRLYEKNRGDKQ